MLNDELSALSQYFETRNEINDLFVRVYHISHVVKLYVETNFANITLYLNAAERLSGMDTLFGICCSKLFTFPLEA
jgi:hypothetical protein